MLTHVLGLAGLAASALLARTTVVRARAEVAGNG